MKIHFFAFAIVFTFCNTSRAEPPLVSQLIEAVVVNNEPKVAELSKQLKAISSQDFIDGLTKHPQLFNLIALSRETFREDIQRYLTNNKLNQMVPGFFYLKEAKDSFVRAAFALELQLIFAESNNSHHLGAKNLANFSHAIAELVTTFYLNADRNLNRVGFSKNLAIKLRDDYVKEVLSKRVLLTPAEQWINESIGLEKNHIHQRDILTLAHSIIKDRRQVLISKVSRRVLTCAQLFAI